MKKSLVCGMGLLLCLMSGVFTGCEDKEKEKGNSAGFGSLEGVVTDKATGEAIAMASVELLAATGRKTQTDEAGAFSFTDVEAGVYRVRVRKGGYVDYTTLDLAVTAGSTVREIIQMEEAQTDLKILDTNDMAMRVLYLEEGAKKGAFKIKNTGSAIVEWEIPKLADGWLGAFSKQSGKLGPGASEKIEFTINEFRLSEGENKMVVYIASPSGDKQLQVVYLLKNRFYVETAFGMEMPLVEVKGGTFEMGATPEQGDDVRDNEKPVHNVSLSPFYIGKYEVTQAQWEAVMGTTVEQHRAWAEAEWLYDGTYCLVGVGPENPMYYVSWNDAVAFCSKLSERTGKKYRLPTEAEWEYAARGGHHHDGTMYAGSDVAYEVAWYWDNNGNGIHSGTRPVGQKKPNGLGIYDMSGNVYERCSDWYDKAYYGVSPAHNPQGPAEGTSRVLRGGDFASRADLHVSFREGGNPRYRLHWIGFRVVCEL